MRHRWHDQLNLLLGAWLLLSPFAGVGGLAGPAAINAFLFGPTIVACAALALLLPRKWQQGVSLAVGLWLILSPFALGFAEQAGPTWNSVLVGLLVAADALWALLQPPLAPARR